MLKNFRLALLFLWREWRAGEWLIVFFALYFAVAAITGLHFYIDRIMRGLEQQNSKLLGGDLIISSPTVLPTAWQQKAKELRLNTAEIWLYPSMVSVKNKIQLVNIQAVSAHFPLLSAHPERPAPESIWVEPRLLPLLSAHINSTVTIGAKDFRITERMGSDFDTLNTGWTIAPRVVMRIEDVAATKTVIPGSRVDFRLLMTGSPQSLNAFRQWITPQLKPGQRILDSRTQQFALRDTLERAQTYLQLVLLICIIMSGVAISISTQQYLRRHYAHVALWRCIGMKEKNITHIFLWQLSMMALSAGLLGIITGYWVQVFIANLLKNILPLTLPASSWAPVFLGFIASSILLFAFAYSVVTELPRISPLYIWRNEINKNTLRSNMYLISSLFLLLFLIYWMMGFSLLTTFLLGVVLISIGFLYAFSLMLLSALRHAAAKTEGTIKRGLSELVHHRESVSIQFVGFSLILTIEG